MLLTLTGRPGRFVPKYILFLVGPTLLVAQSWVPYTATIIESTEVRNSNGIASTTKTEIEESRGPDGSVNRTTKVAGQPARGRITLACGDVVDLDYVTKTARVVSHSRTPHGHFVPSKNDYPAGTEVIEGLNATKWPARFDLGTVALWIDMDNDILVKEQHHQVNPNGVVVDHTSVITAIELNPASSASVDTLPPGFKLDTVANAQSCGSF